jgi:hypothetical protein
LPSHTTLPFASTMQTEIVLSDTSNPTYSAIALPPLTGASDPSSTVVVRGWDRITPAAAERAARAQRLSSRPTCGWRTEPFAGSVAPCRGSPRPRAMVARCSAGQGAAWKRRVRVEEWCGGRP